MSSHALADPFRPRPPEGMRAGAALALLAHAALIAALAVAVHWRNSTPSPVVAELWSALPQSAAPREQAPLQETELEPAAPATRREAPKATPQADIAVKKAQREREERERRDLAERERQKEREKEREREREKARKEQEREKQAKAERERQKEREKERERERAEKLAEKQRQENLNRIKGLAGASGSPDSSGTAAQSSGPSAGYAGRIRARIRPHINYPDASAANPVAEVQIRVAPSGTITGIKLTKPSGVPAWDEAVIRAIERAEVLPLDVDGRVPPVIEIKFSRRE